MRSGKRLSAVAISVLFLFLISAQAAVPETPGRDDRPLYERVEAKLAANPALAKAVGRPSPQLRQAEWLLGRWNVTAHTFKTASRPETTEHGESVVTTILGGTWLEIRDRYAGKVQDVGLLTFNPVSSQWVSVGVDRNGNAITSVGGTWEGNRLVLVARNAEVMGETVTLRQTVEKRTSREYRILNEEQRASGDWLAVDEYVYLKR